MLSRLKQYFRAGHISMTPSMTLSVMASALRRHPSSPGVFPWHVPCDKTRVDAPEHSGAGSLVHGVDTFNGSAAIAAMVSDMGLGKNDSVLLPAYCCGAELGPFRRAGCRVHFYDVNPDLSINREQVEQCLADHPDIRLLFITHYFGVPQPQTAAIAQWCVSKGVVLVEDCAHALYSQIAGKPVGCEGDYAVFSPRKSLPVTEGGRLVSRAALNQSTVEGVRKDVPLLPRLARLCYSLQQGARSRDRDFSLSGAGSVVTIAVMVLPSAFIKIAKAMGSFSPHHWLTPDVEGDEAIPFYNVRISALSCKIILTTEAQSCRQIRRRNYAHWMNSVKAIDNVSPLIRHLPEGSCPLYFPVVVSEPARCVEELAGADIEAFNWWQHVPEELREAGSQSCPVAWQLKRSVVALPVHQLVTQAQVEKMADVLSTAVAKDSPGKANLTLHG